MAIDMIYKFILLFFLKKYFYLSLVRNAAWISVTLKSLMSRNIASIIENLWFIIDKLPVLSKINCLNTDGGCFVAGIQNIFQLPISKLKMKWRMRKYLILLVFMVSINYTQDIYATSYEEDPIGVMLCTFSWNVRHTVTKSISIIGVIGFTLLA
ncbi:MAG TPA: type IV secretion system DNA-binding domain-containing protein [Rickettsia endosymbiont of Pyrocoelia pectoralis]|nr:type IV secretion system DNA-binding domain-containing protein [Rickettsia endosymbiont of Pyrocoelia pectoralis]